MKRSIALSNDLVFNTKSFKPKSWKTQAIARTTLTAVFSARTSCTPSSSPLRGVAVSDNIVDGSTVDDLGDYRPGRQAATQHAVRSPLIEVGLSKSEVRELSRNVMLPTWDKPASPCLSSRIAYGTTVTIERLSKVDRGEEILREFGFREFRVRHHDKLVRLEISPAEMDRVLRKELIDELAGGFVSLDLSMSLSICKAFAAAR